MEWAIRPDLFTLFSVKILFEMSLWSCAVCGTKQRLPKWGQGTSRLYRGSTGSPQKWGILTFSLHKEKLTSCFCLTALPEHTPNTTTTGTLTSSNTGVRTGGVVAHGSGIRYCDPANAPLRKIFWMTARDRVFHRLWRSRGRDDRTFPSRKLPTCRPMFMLSQGNWLVSIVSSIVRQKRE